MTVFFYNTILTTYCFFFCLAIDYYLSKHTHNLGKPHIELSPLIGDVNCAKAFSAGAFRFFLVVLHIKMFKKFCLSVKREIVNVIITC